MREDYSAGGGAWDYFIHDHARSRAYRWGEDGLAGISDDRQRLCFALALWNEQDPILKERLFGLTNSEGNHGEDVKEYYFYLDNTPTHSYMRWLYKYPQRAFPYDDLLRVNRGRSRWEMEYELLDTGIFADDRYFDVFVEYAKADPEDLLVRITVHNRGPEPAPLHLLPTLWFRNSWSWAPGQPRPQLSQSQAASTRSAGPDNLSVVRASHATLGERWLYCEGAPALLFTDNDTNQQRLFGSPNQTPFVKDGINDHLVGGKPGSINPAGTGTKVAAHHRLQIQPGEPTTIRLRLSATDPAATTAPFGPEFDRCFAARADEADGFYQALAPAHASADERSVMRQALAGMLWSKQYYYFDLDRWLVERGDHPFSRAAIGHSSRNREWVHMFTDDIIAMPDKWEYPWFAAWDLAFHAITLAMVDVDFAKQQLKLLLRGPYIHPNGQLPAYEWNFSDVNPPVHAWATLAVYRAEKVRRGKGDLEFLTNAFHKLMLNFTWWVNRKDVNGRNVFQGGFLGLDNIGVFDRSAPLPTGGTLEQADGTAWMAFFCQNMLEIALELSITDTRYEDLVSKFLQHFLWIASAMDRAGHDGGEMWDDEDGFFYDVVRMPDGSANRIQLRSMVGLLPLCATTVMSPDYVRLCPDSVKEFRSFVARHPTLLANVPPPDKPGAGGRHLLALVNETKLRRILTRMLDEQRFFGPYGIRSISRWHLDHPYSVMVHGEAYQVRYEPAESTTGMFGGNSNWRGPVWFPLNFLLIRALLQLHLYYGDRFVIECPTGSGQLMTLHQVANEISNRLVATFLRGSDGRRPVYGGSGQKFQRDPHWRDLLSFYEYFHGDNGAGIGASHQTGWTGLVARLIQMFGDQVALAAQSPQAVTADDPLSARTVEERRA